jgi:hypothetical protein
VKRFAVENATTQVLAAILIVARAANRKNMSASPQSQVRGERLQAGRSVAGPEKFHRKS